MRLIGLIIQKLGIEELTSCVRYTVLDEKNAYFENVKKILEFSPQKIVLCGKDCKLFILGERLTIETFFGGDVTVRGKITAVERCKI